MSVFEVVMEHEPPSTFKCTFHIQGGSKEEVERELKRFEETPRAPWGFCFPRCSGKRHTFRVKEIASLPEGAVPFQLEEILSGFYVTAPSYGGPISR